MQFGYFVFYPAGDSSPRPASQVIDIGGTCCISDLRSLEVERNTRFNEICDRGRKHVMCYVSASSGIMGSVQGANDLILNIFIL